MDDHPIRVLLVDDDEDDAFLTRELLAEIESQRFTLDWVATVEAAIAAWGRQGYEVCLVDYRLGAHTGLDLLRELQAQGCTVPMILLTGQGDHAIDLEAMQVGAADYLVKGQLTAALLERAIRYAIERGRTVDALQRAREAAEAANRVQSEWLQSLEAKVAERTAELHLAVEQARALAYRAEEASRAKSQFLATMSHELRTPLNAILGYSELLHEDANECGHTAYLPDLQRIHAAGHHLLTLIDSVLALAKIEAGKMDLHLAPCDLPPLVQDVVTMVTPMLKKNANTLAVHAPDTLGTIWTDATKVRQVLLNLLSNACKFTEHGRVTLHITRECTAQGEWLTCQVSDTGIGMTPEQMGELFHAFRQVDGSSTRKYGGSGLGLVISRHFCRMLGGDLTVESAWGVGSTFTARFPLAVGLHNHL